MKNSEVRWKQRLNSFSAALAQLKAAVELSQRRSLTELEKQGIIQAFEFTHELAWNVLKDYFDYQGGNLITGSRDATREAFNRGLINDGDAWMEMIKSRNQTSHTYNKATADQIVDNIKSVYFNRISELFTTMRELSKK